MPERSDLTPKIRIFPGAFHGSSSFNPNHPTSVRWRGEEEAFLRRVLGT